MYRIGIDIGSTYTKYCVLRAEEGTMALFSEQTPVRQREYFSQKLPQLQEQYPGCSIVTCGYGRKNICRDESISELTALAAGAFHQCPEAGVILDIGGQDTKLVRQENGRLKAFFTNEKCAAGCGIFLGNVLQLLNMRFEDLDLTKAKEPGLRLSAVCAVFAQSEIVELMARDVPEEEIILAVLTQIFIQAKALLGKVEDAPVLLSGGLTRVPGIQDFAEKTLCRQMLVPENGSYLSAVGCAWRMENNCDF